MTTTATPAIHVRPSIHAERTSGRRWMAVTGLTFIVGALLVNVPYALLIAGFDYPDILRRPAGEILQRFSEAGSGLVFTWLGFAWSAGPLLIGILLLRRILEEDDHPLASVATAFGLVGGVVQMIGLLRWAFVVPGLAETHTAAGAGEATKAAAEIAFNTVHQYGGVVLGEHLGQAFTIAWVVLVSAMMLRSRIFRPWMGWVGIMAAAVYSLAQLELLATVIPGFPYWASAGLVGSSLWLLWMTLLGVQLVARSRTDSGANTSRQVVKQANGARQSDGTMWRE